MSNTAQLSIRVNDENPNHHLWNNNGTWYIHYTVYPNDLTKERVRQSLRTRQLDKARKIRDELLDRLSGKSLCLDYQI